MLVNSRKNKSPAWRYATGAARPSTRSQSAKQAKFFGWVAGGRSKTRNDSTGGPTMPRTWSRARRRNFIHGGVDTSKVHSAGLRGKAAKEARKAAAKRLKAFKARFKKAKSVSGPTASGGGGMSEAAKKAARKRLAALRRRRKAAKAAPKRRKKKSVAKTRRKKASHRKSAKRVAAGKKAARTRKRHKAARSGKKRRRSGKKRATKKRRRSGKRKASRRAKGTRTRGRRASLRTRRRGRSVAAWCKPSGRKGRARLRKRRVGKHVIASCTAKNRRRRKRNFGGGFVGKILGYLPGGDKLSQAVPYVLGGVVGGLGANVLPRFVPGGFNTGLKGVGLSLIGTGVAAWGIQKFLKRSDYALGAAVVGGFLTLTKLIANFTPAGSPIRSFFGVDLANLSDYAGWDSNGYNYGYGYNGDYSAADDSPDEVTDARVAGEIGMDDFLEIPNGMSDCMSIDDEDMADQVELRDFVEIR